MSGSFDSYISTVKSGLFYPKVRITFLNIDETPQSEITADILDGNLNITRTNGSRRSVSLTLDNIKGKYIPNSDNQIFIGRKFFLELGLKEPNGDIYYHPQGIFLLKSPTVESFNSGSKVSINAVDKWYNFETLGKLDGTYTVPVDSDINTTIKSILNFYIDSPRNQIKLDPKNPILQKINSSYINTPYTITEEVSSDLSAILLKLNEINSRNMFYSELGYLISQEDLDDNIKASIWDFVEDEFLYLGASHIYDYESLRNKIIVIGANVNGKIYKGVATNTNPQSDYNIYNIGTRIELIESDIYNSDELCQKYAEYLLKRKNALLSSVTIQCPSVLFHLDVDNVITLTDLKLGLNNSRFLITDISIPFSPNSSMSITAVKTDELVIGGA
jgi:hypothetical protein